MRHKRLIFTVLFILTLLQHSSVYSQNIKTNPIECGNVIDAELTAIINQEAHQYIIDFAAGDAISVTVIPVGTTPNLYFNIADSNDVLILNTWGYGSPDGYTEFVTDFVLPSTGEYKINVFSFNVAAAYTIQIGCLLRDGTRINPGDNVPEVSPPPQNTSVPENSNPQVASTFSGRGFMGLAPVDFSQGVTIPMALAGASNVGSISNEFVGIFGFSLSANQGDQFSLNFTRQSGNLNLGIAMISANNVVVFESSLMSASILITQFSLPVTGEYTIGVYRSSLMQPTDAVATSFSIAGTINP